MTTARRFQSTMNPRLLLVESPFQDTVIYQYIERPMDIHHAPSTHIHHNDQVCYTSLKWIALVTQITSVFPTTPSSEHQPCPTQRSTSLGRSCRTHEGVGTQIPITLWLISQRQARSNCHQRRIWARHQAKKLSFIRLKFRPQKCRRTKNCLLHHRPLSLFLLLLHDHHNAPAQQHQDYTCLYL